MTKNRRSILIVLFSLILLGAVLFLLASYTSIFQALGVLIDALIGSLFLIDWSNIL